MEILAEVFKWVGITGMVISMLLVVIALVTYICHQELSKVYSKLLGTVIVVSLISEISIIALAILESF